MNSYLSTDFQKRLFSLIDKLFSESTQKPYRDHTQRVLIYCREIGTAEGANLELLTAAALVHDIGMTVDPSFTGHIKETIALGKPLLLSVGYPDLVADRILHVASQHHPPPGETLSDLESQVLFDADNMDIVGVYGTLRWFGESGKDLSDAVASADLFLALFRANTAARGSLFHTAYARQIGDAAAGWTAAYCDSIREYEQTLRSETPPHHPFVIP